MKTRRVSDFLSEMRNMDPRLAKAGVQAACEYLEAGRGQAHHEPIMAALSYQLDSRDTKVLRWVYKSIALLKNPRYLNYLGRQLSGRDLDPENRLWAYAATASLTPEHRRVLNDAGDEFSLPYALASGLYGREPELAAAVRRAGDTDDAHAHQFIGLLYGEGNTLIPRRLLSELTASASAESVEYAIWGLRKRGGASWNDVRIDPFAIAEQPENVRRWYYRLVAQHPESRNQLSSAVLSWIENETASLPREGLAFGLFESERDGQWDAVLRSWRRTETDPFVRRALGAKFEDGPGSVTSFVDRSRAPSRASAINTRGIVVMIAKNIYTNPIIGVVQERGGTVTGNVTVGGSGLTGADLSRVLNRLSSALESDPAAGPAIVADVQQLATTAAAAGNDPVKPTFLERLRGVAEAVRSVTSLGKAAGDVLDTLDGMGVLS